MDLLICIGCSVIVSAITTRILAIHYFQIVDGYVDDMCKKTREFVNSFLCK